MGVREQRIAENETRFRQANEHLLGEWREMGLPPERETFFLCECGDMGCTEVIRLARAEYEAVRADPNTFFVVPGHDDPATERIVTGEVVERNDRFAVVCKREPNRTDTEASDPRSG